MRRPPVRDLITTAAEVVGLGVIVAGVWLIFMPAALIVAGAGVLALAWGASR